MAKKDAAAVKKEKLYPDAALTPRSASRQEVAEEAIDAAMEVAPNALRPVLNALKPVIGVALSAWTASYPYLMRLYDVLIVAWAFAQAYHLDQARARLLSLLRCAA